MKRQMRTAKKKSEANSRTPARLTVYDTVNGKLVGRPLYESASEIMLQHAGVLMLRPEAKDGGERFEIKASISNPMLVGEHYHLLKYGIRGYAYPEDAWLEVLYNDYVTRVARGDYRLNPYAPPAEMSLQQGDGAPAATEAVISEVRPEGGK
jgi:hypothetical protein